MSDLTVNAASDFAQQQVQQKIAYALMAKQLDAAKQQGDAIAQLLQSASQVGKAVGKGQRLDLLS